MITTIALYFISYLLTLNGFILGSITHYELKEIKQKALIISKVFFILPFILALYYTFDSYLLLLTIFSIILFIVCEYKLKSLQTSIYNIIFAVTFFIFLQIDKFEYFPLLVFALIINNSFKSFSYKEQIIQLLIIIVLFGIITIFIKV